MDRGWSFSANFDDFGLDFDNYSGILDTCLLCIFTNQNGGRFFCRWRYCSRDSFSFELSATLFLEFRLTCFLLLRDNVREKIGWDSLHFVDAFSEIRSWSSHRQHASQEFLTCCRIDDFDWFVSKRIDHFLRFSVTLYDMRL